MSAKPDLKLIIGNKNLSSWSMRPWLLLRHAGIAFEEHVFLFEERDWLEKIVSLSPSRKVPALRHGDVVIWDSLAICEYVAELFPDAQLWPSDREARAVARSVSSEMHSSFAHVRKDMSMDVTARNRRRTTLSHETQSEVDRIVAIWEECRTRFGTNAGDGGAFLFGRFSVADAMFAPVVWRFRTNDVPFAPSSTAARAWYEMMIELPAMKAWERDAEDEVLRGHTSRAGIEPTTPDPTSALDCFAVIFSSQLKPEAKTKHGYDADAVAMEELAKKQQGFLGIESARSVDGFGVTVSYWDSLEAIARWKAHADHQKVQSRGREIFYERYEIRICSVERGYKFPVLRNG